MKKTIKHLSLLLLMLCMSTVAMAVDHSGYYRIQGSRSGRLLVEDAESATLKIKTTTGNTAGELSEIWQIRALGDAYVMINAATGRFVQTQLTTNKAVDTSSSTLGLYHMMASGSKFAFSATGVAADRNALHEDNTNSVVVWSATSSDACSFWTISAVTGDDLTKAKNSIASFETKIASVIDKFESLNLIGSSNDLLQKYFDDFACTQLKAEYASLTPEALRSQMQADNMPERLQEMAVSILTSTWDSTKDATYNGWVKFFRIQDVQCYSDNKVWGDITKVGPFSELTSPTGIQGKKGDIVLIFVDQAVPTNATLRAMLAYDTEYRNKGELSLKKGVNVWQLPETGEVFITYFCTKSSLQLSTFPKIRVHVEGGEANGCWDLSRDMTNEDWAYLKDNFFKGEFLHVKGLNTVLNLVKEKAMKGDANKPAPTKPVEIMKGWDFAFLGLQKAIGHTGQWDGRYNPVVNPRHSYSGNPNWGGYGGSNHTNITNGYLFNYDNFYNGNVWELLHEIGHGCQGPIKMAGTTEVTNNSLAQIVSHMMGNNYSRGNGTDRLVQLFNYERDGKRGWTWVDYVRYATPFYDSSLHTGNHLLYQLYLYFEVLGHNPGFLTRLMNEMRTNPITYSGKGDINGTPKTYNDDFWKFAKACSKASETDLWEFFEAYGFWKYADEIISSSTDDPEEGSTAWKNGNRFIGDYGNYSLKLPVRGNKTDESRMKTLRTFMAGQPNKAPNLMFIDDHVRKSYVDAESFVAQIESTRAGKELMSYWNVPFVDFGDYRDFDGENRTENLKYSISASSTATQDYTTDKGGEWNYTVKGKKITISGKGVLGVKLYDAEGNLVYLANTRTFVLPVEKANALKDGTLVMHIAATPTEDVVMGTDGLPVQQEDGISQPISTLNTQSSALYDLSGRSYVRLPKSGLYIQNGRKVIR